MLSWHGVWQISFSGEMHAVYILSRSKTTTVFKSVVFQTLLVAPASSVSAALTISPALW
jgi:hypothetical protein